MKLETMLRKCDREQWSVNDLDWSGTPRPMSREDEIAIVQYFTDMAGIERLAGALFAEQAKRAEDPVLRQIFKSFVRDEARHAAAAERLAKYYDVNHYQSYEMTQSLVRFAPHFVKSVKFLSPDIANAYITSGELILDIALLRSLDDHVGDKMSGEAMELINRDESRHIAVDFHMVDYYCSQEYAQRLAAMPPAPLSQRVRALWAFAHVLYYASPFFKEVFFEPMRVVDPTGKRMKEAFKRIQLIARKPTYRRSNFVKVMGALQSAYNASSLVRMVFGKAIERIVGVEPELLVNLYTDAERERASRMSWAEFADDALAAKAIG